MAAMSCAGRCAHTARKAAIGIEIGLIVPLQDGHTLVSGGGSWYSRLLKRTLRR
jgi:hypothetical protein